MLYLILIIIAIGVVAFCLSVFSFIHDLECRIKFLETEYYNNKVFYFDEVSLSLNNISDK